MKKNVLLVAAVLSLTGCYQFTKSTVRDVKIDSNLALPKNLQLHGELERENNEWYLRNLTNNRKTSYYTDLQTYIPNYDTYFARCNGTFFSSYKKFNNCGTAVNQPFANSSVSLIPTVFSWGLALPLLVGNHWVAVEFDKGEYTDALSAALARPEMQRNKSNLASKLEEMDSIIYQEKSSYDSLQGIRDEISVEFRNANERMAFTHARYTGDVNMLNKLKAAVKVEVVNELGYKIPEVDKRKIFDVALSYDPNQDQKNSFNIKSSPTAPDIYPGQSIDDLLNKAVTKTNSIKTNIDTIKEETRLAQTTKEKFVAENKAIVENYIERIKHTGALEISCASSNNILDITEKYHVQVTCQDKIKFNENGILEKHQPVVLRFKTLDMYNVNPAKFTTKDNIIDLVKDSNVVTLYNKTKDYVTIDTISLYCNGDIISRSGNELNNFTQIPPKGKVSYSVDMFGKMNNDYKEMTKEKARKTKFTYGFAVKYRVKDNTSVKNIFEEKEYTVDSVFLNSI